MSHNIKTRLKDIKTWFVVKHWLNYKRKLIHVLKYVYEIIKKITKNRKIKLQIWNEVYSNDSVFLYSMTKFKI